MTILTGGNKQKSEDKEMETDRFDEVPIEVEFSKGGGAKLKESDGDSLSVYESTEKWKIYLYTIILILLIAAASLATGRIAYQYFVLGQNETKTGSVRVMYQVGPPEGIDLKDWMNAAEDPWGEKVGTADEWFSVGPSQWLMDSYDETKRQNYSILTDLLTNYTVIKMLNPESKGNLEETACFLAETSMLPLPKKDELDEFLNQVEDEAAMLVTKFKYLLFFDIGQPISLDAEKYGKIIHEFCKGRMTFQLEPLNLAEMLTFDRNEVQERANERENMGGQIVDEVAEIVDNLIKKYATTKAPVVPYVAATTTFQFPPGWDAERRAETAEDLQKLNNDLVNALNAGNIRAFTELTMQFHEIMAYLPSGSYTLHSPEGQAMSIQIRKQTTPFKATYGNFNF